MQLSEIIAANPVAASGQKTNKNIPDKFLQKDLNLYAKEKWDEVYKILTASSFSQQTLHTIRKYLKDLFYNLKKNKGLPKHIRAKMNEKYFKKLLDELGNFQDMCAGLALLKPSWLKKLNTKWRPAAMGPVERMVRRRRAASATRL